jgi:hypothetical protein
MDVPGGGSVHVAHVRGEAVIADDVLESSLAALLGSFDIVLVDGGRLERSAAAFALVGPVGAVAAVVPGKRGGKQLQELRQRLALAGRECAGVIATRRDWVPRSERSVPPPTAGRSQAPPPPPERGSSPATGSTVTAGRPS